MSTTLIGSDIGLSPVQHQAIFWTNTDHYKMDPWEQILIKYGIEMQKYSGKKEFKDVVCKLQPFASAPVLIKIPPFVNANLQSFEISAQHFYCESLCWKLKVI